MKLKMSFLNTELGTVQYGPAGLEYRGDGAAAIAQQVMLCKAHLAAEDGKEPTDREVLEHLAKDKHPARFRVEVMDSPAEVIPPPRARHSSLDR